MRRKIRGGGVKRERETNTPNLGIEYKKHSSTIECAVFYKEKSDRSTCLKWPVHLKLAARCLEPGLRLNRLLRFP